MTKMLPPCLDLIWSDPSAGAWIDGLEHGFGITFRNFIIYDDWERLFDIKVKNRGIPLFEALQSWSRYKEYNISSTLMEQIASMIGVLTLFYHKKLPRDSNL